MYLCWQNNTQSRLVIAFLPRSKHLLISWLQSSPTMILKPKGGGGGNLSQFPVFPPSSFILQSFVWFYTFFSTGQVLLAALSCCSACTSVSEGEFLMYLWSEMYPMSSSTILLSLCFLICCLGLSMLFFQGASVF